MTMTKQEFKDRWDGDDNGGGISFDDIADCAKAWGLFRNPKTCRIDMVRYQVLKEAGTVDAEEYAPDKESDDD
jgi:hypothetical protein